MNDQSRRFLYVVIGLAAGFSAINTALTTPMTGRAGFEGKAPILKIADGPVIGFWRVTKNSDANFTRTTPLENEVIFIYECGKTPGSCGVLAYLDLGNVAMPHGLFTVKMSDLKLTDDVIQFQYSDGRRIYFKKLSDAEAKAFTKK
jgi:hypothetical protein